MKNYKSFNQWMGEQGFNALRHANCCRIAYEGGQESMKIRIDEVQESNLNLEGECVHLQKRIDEALVIIEKHSRYIPFSAEQAIREALRGGHE
ncbi:hypothetical protein NI468_01935 [Acinetobacter lwoffii]|uniref:hypothetical protein n=1 Tax=Acinetobacter lwoffii TaxID=28090 RepID=UPI002097584F|nr:hypothetical protein [Acinetobacter lwoffii]MCO8069302.1 hypothetical protein [Acinetobacter lwoffii]